MLLSHLDARQQAALFDGADAFINKVEMPKRVAEGLRAAAEGILSPLQNGEGFPVLQDIKARPPAQIAIILTSFPFQEYRDTYHAAGADYFFDKIKDIPQMTEKLFELASKNGDSADE